jgi:hypothetical protein
LVFRNIRPKEMAPDPAESRAMLNFCPTVRMVPAAPSKQDDHSIPKRTKKPGRGNPGLACDGVVGITLEI